MKQILLFLSLVLFQTALVAQVKTAGVNYSVGAPAWTPSVNTGSELAIDTISKRLYLWNRNTATWDIQGQGIDVVSGATAPAYVPNQTDSKFAINNDNELYYYTGSAWAYLNAGATYTAGTGIGIAGTVISNTGDLSNTNELQTIDTFSVSGQTLSVSLSSDGQPARTVTLPASGSTTPQYFDMIGTGQSNMVNRDITVGTWTYTVNPRVLAWQAGTNTWAVADPALNNITPQDQTGTRNNTAWQFALRYAEENPLDTVRMLVRSIGGLGSWEWTPKTTGPGEVASTNTMINDIIARFATMPANFNAKAIIFQQGESDDVQNNARFWLGNVNQIYDTLVRTSKVADNAYFILCSPSTLASYDSIQSSVDSTYYKTKYIGDKRNIIAAQFRILAGVDATHFTNEELTVIANTTYSVWKQGLTPGPVSTVSGSTGQVGFFSSRSTLTGNSSLFWDNVNNRLGVGINASLLSRLHVVGSGSTSSSFIARFDNSLGTNSMLLRDDGAVFIPSVTFGGTSSGCRIRGVGTVNQEFMELASSSLTNITTVDFQFTNPGGPATQTAGPRFFIDIGGGFSPTSGTGTYASLNLRGTINQTGTANGVVNGIHINQTITSAPNYRALQTSNNTGYSIYTAGTAPSYFLGNIGIGVLTTTARLHLPAGTATANTAPLKFTSGTSLTTPENGAIEYNGTDLFITTGGVRQILAKSLQGSATLNYPSISAGATSDLTITVTGASTTDKGVSVMVPNTAVSSGLMFFWWISATDTVTVRAYNTTGGAIDPASATFNATVFK